MIGFVQGVEGIRENDVQDHYGGGRKCERKRALPSTFKKIFTKASKFILTGFLNYGKNIHHEIGKENGSN